MKSHLKKGLEKLSKKLDIELSYTVANHNFELGLPLENSLKNFYTPYFPSRYKFGSGYLVDLNESLSNQCDWIIYDPMYFSPLIGKANSGDGVEFFPFDSTYAVIEVKRTLKNDTLDKAIKQIAITKRLKRKTCSPSNVTPLLDMSPLLNADASGIETNHLLTGIYAYSMDELESPQEILDALRNYDFDELPNFIAVHGHFFIVKTQCYQTPTIQTGHRLSYLPQHLNGFSCIESGSDTAATFYAYILNQLNNMFLSAHDYKQTLASLVSDFNLLNSELHPTKNVAVYDKEI